jgi:hypothetical protein
MLKLKRQPASVGAAMGMAGLRRVRRQAPDEFGWLTGWLLAALWAANRHWPVRVADLKRLTRQDNFRAAQSATAAWLDEHFYQIEEGALWLDRVGRWVNDGCSTSLGT